MKNSKTIYTVASITAALIIGFVIGISINFPKVNNSDVSGTIGKVDNYHNVKVTEADIQLRSDLLNDKQKRKDYENFYAYHYTTLVKQTQAIDYALEAVEKNDTFKNANKSAVESLVKYRNSIEQSRAPIILAHAAIKNINSDTPTAIKAMTMAINNANIAIMQMDYKNSTVLDFVEALDGFIQDNNNTDTALLVKAHDLLTINQLSDALITNDKPMLKYLNKKEIYSCKDELNTLMCISSGVSLNDALAIDVDKLQIHASQELFSSAYAMDKQEISAAFESLNDVNSLMQDQISQLINNEQLNFFGDQSSTLKIIFDDESISSAFENSALNNLKILNASLINMQQKTILFLQWF